jgi:hypothetical protein
MKAAYVGFVVKKVYLKILGVFHASWHLPFALYYLLLLTGEHYSTCSFPADRFCFVHALVGCCGEFPVLSTKNTSMNM